MSNVEREEEREEMFLPPYLPVKTKSEPVATARQFAVVVVVVVVQANFVLRLSEMAINLSSKL